MSFFERLEARVRAADSLLCVGLDPRAETASAAQAECLRVLEATQETAAAYKLNSAFFEVFGGEARFSRCLAERG
jgi:uridine monophosphate synthetase